MEMSVFKEAFYEVCIEILCGRSFSSGLCWKCFPSGERLTDVEIFQLKPRWTTDQHANSAARRWCHQRGERVEHTCSWGGRVGVLLQEHCTDPVCGELIMSCQWFQWQVFIYQVVVFQWTWQSYSRCEGQQQSHILIKDQGAKNKTPPAGATLRLKEMWKGSVVYTY